jgi:hypothetical protein
MMHDAGNIRYIIDSAIIDFWCDECLSFCEHACLIRGQCAQFGAQGGAAHVVHIALVKLCVNVCVLTQQPEARQDHIEWARILETNQRHEK